MPDISLIAFDLDGTLLDSRRRILPAVKEVIGRLQAQGTFVTVITGRPLAATEPYIRELGLMIPFGLMHGALVRDIQGLEIVKRAIPDIGVREALDLALQHECVPFVIGCTAGGTLVLCEEHRDHPAVVSILSVGGSGREISGDDVLFFRREEIQTAAYTIYLVGKNERIATLLEEFESQKVRLFSAQRFPLHSMGAIPGLTDTHEVVMLSPMGTDKGTALEAIADTLSVPLENVLAFGDWHNDIPMLRVAGHAVLMGNAPAGLVGSIEHPHLIRTGSNDGTGIIDGLTRFGLP